LTCPGGFFAAAGEASATAAATDAASTVHAWRGRAFELTVIVIPSV
jgi:hypothetical protein